MAHIEIWTRDISGLSSLEKYAPQHIFLLKVNDDGTREILRGGPENDNMLGNNLLVVKQNYDFSKQLDKVTNTYDWYNPTLPNTSHYQGKTIYTSTQSDIDARWNAACSMNRILCGDEMSSFVIERKHRCA